jgi:hypothetical protein
MTLTVQLAFQEIMQAIKGASAHRTNKVWGEEGEFGRRSHLTTLFATKGVLATRSTIFWETQWEPGSLRIHWNIVGCGGIHSNAAQAMRGQMTGGDARPP